MTHAGPVVPDDERWSGRPILARTVRVVVFAGPLLISLVVTTAATRLYGAPRGTAARIGWWAGLLLLSTLTVWAADRILRRLMPLAALLEMSVLFPGRAPTRFSVARQTGTTRQLEELVARARASDETTEPVVAASRILALVGALRSHDRATRGHSERVRVMTDLVAEEMGLSVADRDRLRWAALLHDIGKLDVPSKILNKPAEPTDREWERLRRHPEVGQELAGPLLSWLGAAGPVIVQHHERWDGSGYPAGLVGEQICLGARIVAVADTFEVMTAARSYKKALPRAVALREMAKLSGTQFDPAAVRALLSISAPRLRWAIGPWAWLAQIPVIGTAPSLAGVSTVASQAAAGAGAVGLGTAVGLTALTPHHVSGEVSPQVLTHVILQQPAPAAATLPFTAPSPTDLTRLRSDVVPAQQPRTVTQAPPKASAKTTTASKATPSPSPTGPGKSASRTTNATTNSAPSPTPTASTLTTTTPGLHGPKLGHPAKH